MIWTPEQVDGETVWRADIEHGAPLALVVSPRPEERGWGVMAGGGSTRDIVENGGKTTIATKGATAEQAKAEATAWVASVQESIYGRGSTRGNAERACVSGAGGGE